MLLDGARRARDASHGRIGRVDAAGLVAALQFTKPGTTEPDPDTAFYVYQRVVEAGVMLFSPVGVGGCCIKLNPPLMIDEGALREGLDVVVEACGRRD